MIPRQIVRHPDVAFGRWRFENTSIFIDDLRTDSQLDEPAAHVAYSALGLSDAEFAAALAFDFPEIAKSGDHFQSPHLLVHCTCGIVRTALVDPTTMETDLCPCGRRWKVTVTLTEVSGAAVERSGSGR